MALAEAIDGAQRRLAANGTLGELGRRWLGENNLATEVLASFVSCAYSQARMVSPMSRTAVQPWCPTTR